VSRQERESERAKACQKVTIDSYSLSVEKHSICVVVAVDVENFTLKKSEKFGNAIFE
jgi:hypothetical protein